jgi:hypothetical protein
MRPRRDSHPLYRPLKRTVVAFSVIAPIAQAGSSDTFALLLLIALACILFELFDKP